MREQSLSYVSKWDMRGEQNDGSVLHVHICIHSACIQTEYEGAITILRVEVEDERQKMMKVRGEPGKIKKQADVADTSLQSLNTELQVFFFFFCIHLCICTLRAITRNDLNCG